MTTFNPYQEWLGIESSEPDFYELIGIEPGESDQSKISTAVDRAISTVRSHRPGSHAREWSALLDQLKSAKLILADPTKRQEYDAILKEKPAPSPDQEQEESGFERSVEPTTSVDPNLLPPGAAPPRQPETAAPANSATRDKRLDQASPAAGSAPSSPTPPAAPTPAKAPAPASPQPEQSPAAVVPLASQPALMANDPMAPVAAQPSASGPPSAVAGPPASLTTPGVATPGAAPSGPPASTQPDFAPTVPQALAPTGGQTNSTVSPAGVASPPLTTQPPSSATPMGTTPSTTPGANVPSAMSPANIPSAVTSGAPTANDSAAAPGAHEAKSSSPTFVSHKNPKKNQLPMLITVAATLVLATIGVVAFALGGFSFGNKAAEVAQQQNDDAPTNQQPQSTEPAPSPYKSTKAKPDKPDPKPSNQPDNNSPPGGPDGNPEQQTDSNTPPVPQGNPELPPMKEDPKPDPDPMPTGPTDAQIAEVAAKLKSARDALGTRDFAEFEKLIADAEKLPAKDEDVGKLTRLKLVGAYTKQFEDAYDMGLASLDAGHEIKIGTSTIVLVVEKKEKEMILRVQGNNRTYKYKDMNNALRIGIAETYLKRDEPATLLVKGSYLASQSRPKASEISKLKTWWKAAELQGVEVEDLNKFLEDKYE